MKKPIAFSTIGIFVVAAIVLLISGILFFGSGRAFTSSETYVLFFNQSVNGLKLGAPVRFRGVEVGRVDRIAVGGGERSEPNIAVFVQLYRSNRIQEFGFDYDFATTEQVQALTQTGLKAQLRSQSILSGELYVGLDMYPDEETKYVLPPDSSWVEIPTVRSGLMEDFTANSADISHSLTGALDNLQRVLLNMDAKLDPLTNESLETMKEIRQMMRSVTEFIDPDSPVGYQVPKTLAELERAARSIRLLADYLERNPSSVIFGKSRVEVVERP